MNIPSQFSNSPSIAQCEVHLAQELKKIAEQMHCVSQQFPKNRPPRGEDFTPAIVAQLNANKNHAEQIFKEIQALSYERFCFVMELAIVILTSHRAGPAAAIAQSGVHTASAPPAADLSTWATKKIFPQPAASPEQTESLNKLVEAYLATVKPARIIFPDPCSQDDCATGRTQPPAA